MEENTKEPQEEKKEEVKTKTKKDFIPILLYFLMQAVAMTILSIITVVKTGTPPSADSLTNDQKFFTLYLIVWSAITAITLLFIYRKKVKSDCKRLTKKAVGFAFLAAIGLLLVNALMMTVAGKLGLETENQELLSELTQYYKIPYALTLIVFMPFVEEMLCRFSIRTICNNKLVFIMVSSLVFALLHGVGAVIIVYFIIGVILGLVYLKSDENILCSYLVHLLNNLVAVLELFLL